MATLDRLQESKAVRFIRSIKKRLTYLQAHAALAAKLQANDRQYAEAVAQSKADVAQRDAQVSAAREGFEDMVGHLHHQRRIARTHSKEVRSCFY